MRRRSFIQTLILSSGALIIGNSNAFSRHSSDKVIRVSMIYNNIGKDESMESDWGLSILVESDKETLLFDTGRKPEILLENMNHAGVDLSKISDIVISHNHSDHVNGLDAFLEKDNLKPKVYVPEYNLEGIHSNFKTANLIGVSESLRINENVWTIGQLVQESSNNPIYEQSIVVKNENSIYLFTGCSHPGIIKIVEHTRRLFSDEDLKLVAGGFHLIRHSDKQVYDISDKLKNLSVEKIAPSHCTGDNAIAIFLDEWGNDFINFDLSRNSISV